MSEIKIQIQELNGQISRLSSLQSKVNGLNTTSPQTVGGGKSVNELEAIAAVYKSMTADVGTLISNTISFMQNVGASFQTSDNKAANKIN